MMSEEEVFDSLKYRIVRGGFSTIYYNSDNEMHRGNDLPAIIWANGSQEWYVNGVRHRDNDLPTVIWADGSTLWYLNEKLHRDNGLPAVIWADGSQFWYVNGKLIR
jgi:hypothetical protein